MIQNDCIAKLCKVHELKVCIFSRLFTFPVARFCQILKKHLGKELCPGQDLKPLACEASVLPFCHSHYLAIVLKVEKLFKFLFTLPVAQNCQKSNIHSFASSTLVLPIWIQKWFHSKMTGIWKKFKSFEIIPNFLERIPNLFQTFWKSFQMFWKWFQISWNLFQFFLFLVIFIKNGLFSSLFQCFTM